MAKEPKGNIAKYVCIAVIALFGGISGMFMLGDTKQAVDDAGGIDTIVSESPAGKIITNFEQIGTAGEDVQDNFHVNWEAVAKSASGDSEAEDITGNRYEATFVRAKDGDTYVLSVNDVENTVRLIGVDTPESVAPASYGKENTAEGKEVSEIVKEKLHEGDKVYIEFDVSDTDRYNRFLCYVYFEDGTMVQDWLLENGYARTMTVAPNVKYADHFKEIQHKAAENKVGFWNGFFEEESEN